MIQYGLLHRPKALAIDPRKNNDTSHGSMGAANGEKTGAMKFEGPWIGLFGKACRKLMALLISLSLPPLLLNLPRTDSEFKTVDSKVDMTNIREK